MEETTRRLDERAASCPDWCSGHEAWEADEDRAYHVGEGRTFEVGDSALRVMRHRNDRPGEEEFGFSIDIGEWTITADQVDQERDETLKLFADAFAWMRREVRA